MAEDGFDSYFAEKLWEMIPAVYRHEDGLGDNPGVLRALVAVLASQAAMLRRSHDRLWDDQFIELCEDWAVPYLADLVGTRLVSSLDLRARRVDVAKTIYYRRRKGTLAVLEELIGDIADWEGTVVENFRRLARARHRLDPPPAPFAGRFSGTLPGGWADLRSPRGAEQTGGPFDEFHHTPDFRRHRGIQGRYNIPKLAFHLYRLKAYRVEGVTPCLSVEGGYTFDPSGRDVPLFARRARSGRWQDWRAALEWELPAPIRCRILAYAMDELVPAALAIGEVETVETGAIAAADLGGWARRSTDKRVMIDPERGRLLFSEGGVPTVDWSVAYHYGFSGEIGAGTYDRAYLQTTEGYTAIQGGSIDVGAIPLPGLVQVEDSATYTVNMGELSVSEALTIQAANAQRPYLRLTSSGGDGGLALVLTGVADARLTVDGLWIGATESAEIVLSGDFEQVALRHLTLDPGGERSMDGSGDGLPAVSLVIEGHVEQLTIESSITGPICTRGEGMVEELVIRDSIVQSQDSTIPALALGGGVVTLQRVTVLGELNVHRLWASEALITGLATVTDVQTGCFRFSAAPVASSVPKPYEPCWIAASQQLFTSRRFGSSGFCQLSEAAPEALRRGAENGSEIGAFSSLLNPIKFDSLQAKIQEYMPFGLIPLFIYET